MRIAVQNHQRRFHIRRPALLVLAKQLAHCARQRTPGLAWQEVTIHLLDDAGILPINRTILRHEGATDIITQRYDACPGEAEGLIGELFVNVERAATLPCRRGWTRDQELALYLAHGFDHLSGADDATAISRAQMRRRELRWLRETGFSAAGPDLFDDGGPFKASRNCPRSEA